MRAYRRTGGTRLRTGGTRPPRVSERLARTRSLDLSSSLSSISNPNLQSSPIYTLRLPHLAPYITYQSTPYIRRSSPPLSSGSLYRTAASRDGETRLRDPQAKCDH